MNRINERIARYDARINSHVDPWKKLKYMSFKCRYLERIAQQKEHTCESQDSMAGLL